MSSELFLHFLGSLYRLYWGQALPGHVKRVASTSKQMGLSCHPEFQKSQAGACWF